MGTTLATILTWALMITANAGEPRAQKTSTLAGDIAFDKTAYRLELVRNQMELTVQNEASIANDVQRQERDQLGLELFMRIPPASKDARNQSAILAGIREDLQKRGADKKYRIKALSFNSAWKAAPKKIPATVPFDEAYRVPDEQLVDSRELSITVTFDGAAPADPVAWTQEQRDHVRRLIVPAARAKWKLKGKTWSGHVTIFRFREFTFPRIVAPDLGRYPSPGKPVGESQQRSAKRIARYRQDIVTLWPKVQPHLDKIRQFALNDARMSFFLQYATAGGGKNSHGH